MKHKEDLFKVMRAIFPVSESSWTSNEAPRPVCDHFSRTHLLLSASQLIEENYPLPLKGKLRAR
jgi:RNA exonuclease 1